MRCTNRFIILVMFLITLHTTANAESVNEILTRVNYEKVYSFDTIENPSLLDSLQYLSNLAYISSNYCDSTTVAYHADIIDRIYDVYTQVEKHIKPIDNLNSDLLLGLLEILFTETPHFQMDNNSLIKIHYLVFDLSNKLYQYISDEEKNLLLSVIITSYLDTDIQERIVNIWEDYIAAISSTTVYSSSADLLHNLAINMSFNGEYDVALKIGSTLLNKCTSLFEDTSAEWLDCYISMSFLYYNSNCHEEAKNTLDQAIESMKLLNRSDRDMVVNLRNMTNCLFTMGYFQDAVTYACHVLDTYDSKSSAQYIYDLSTFACCKFYVGEREKAIQILRELIDFDKSYESQILAFLYHTISTLYRLNHDYTNSMYYGALCVAELEKIPMDNYDNLFIAYVTYVNLGDAYYQINDIMSSLSMLKEAASVHKQLIAIHRFDKQRIESEIIFWSVLARDYMLTNNPDDGEEALHSALELAKDYYGEQNVEYSKIYAILADLKLIKGDVLGAKEVYSNVLKNTDSSIIYYYWYLSGYADCCLWLELYDEAMNAISEVCSKVLTTRHLITLSRCEFFSGKYNNMREHLAQIYERNTREVTNSFLTLNDIQRRSFWSGPYVGYWFQEELPSIILCSETEDPELSRLLYDATIFSKGILLSTEIDINNILRNSDDQTIKDSYARFIELKGHLDSSNNSVDYSLLDENARLESILMQYIRDNHKSFSSLNINSKDIQSAMSPNSVAIEFIAFHNNSELTEHYCAIVLEPDSSISPQIIKLFDSNQFDSISQNEYFNSMALTTLIWGPLNEFLNAYDTIYFSPAGELNNIPIEYLPALQGNGYISDHKAFFRLSNTREIINRNMVKSIDNANLFGGMIYDAIIKETTNSSTMVSHNMFTNEFINSNCKVHVYLPYSKVEVEVVDSILKQYNVVSQLNTGIEGTEDVLKNMVRYKSPNILHIATHGIFYSNEDIIGNPLYADLSFIKQSEHNNVYTEDLSMTQSVLLFSGADAVFNGVAITDPNNDGILTALEISLLDLTDTDLVTLSACQSGLGEIKGDGVYGLQRGFKKAGVNSILMSLWDVDDEATQLLMTEFYKHYLNGMSKRESLLAAQKVVRETPGFEDPEYWAAFILLDALN